MRRFTACCIAVLAAACLATSASAITFEFETLGYAIPGDCDLTVFPPQPACVVIDVSGTSMNLTSATPGPWTFSAHGQVLFGSGAGTFTFDDTSAANNDFFGTWTNTLSAPNASGVAESDFVYTVLGGSGIFAGLTGAGTSHLFVTVAPSFITGNPVAPCASVTAQVGAFCEQGRFVIPEPHALALVLLALLAVAWRRARR